MEFELPRNKRDDPLILADLTNLLDILLILVIFFIVSTTITPPLLSLKLPESDSAFTDRSKYNYQTLHLSLRADGSYRLQSQDYDFDQLKKQLQKMYSKNPQRKLILYADQKVTVGDFMRLVDLTKLIGFEEINIASNPVNNL